MALMHRRVFALRRSILRLLVPCLGTLLLTTPQAAALPSGFSLVRTVSGLRMPMAFVFAPDGRILVAERAGRVRVVKNGVPLDDAALVLSVLTDGERGLMSLALDPAFATNGWFYVYYTTTGATPLNRVSRFTLQGDVAVAGSELVLFQDEASAGGYHNGGWIDIGPDGYLYISTGDAQVPANSASLSNLKGKVLRLERSGAIPANNPFVGVSGARPEIFVYGLRNPFRATFALDGRLVVGDVGQDAFEEVNVASLAGGNNFGWPTTEGPTTTAGVTSPIHSYETEPTASITMGAFTTSSTVYPRAYRGALFFADFMRDTISVLRETTSGVTVEAFDTGRDAVVAMRRGPDGSIYYASLFGGAIYRIHAEPEPAPPELTLSVAPASAPPGTTVTITARVTPGSAPASTGIGVTADLSVLGGSATQALRDDGADGDLVAGDGIWTHRVVVSALPPASVAIAALATDLEGRSASATTAFEIVAAPVVPPDPTLEALASQCASMFGLRSPAGALFGGALADADGDGRSNQAECAEGVHPRGYFSQYFAEGATGDLFAARLSLTNPRQSLATLCATCGSPAHVQLSFLLDDGTVVREQAIVPEGTEQTIELASIPGLAGAEFSIDVTSDVPVVVERTMSWADGSRGAHAEQGVAEAGRTWFFAEGATHNGFDLFYLLANPGATPAQVTVRYLLPAGQPITVDYEVPAHSRRTIWVNHEDPRLGATDVSAHIVSSEPIIAERAMYLRAATGGWSAGHAAAAVSSPAAEWFFAEGATGPYFDTYLLLANPGSNPVDVRVAFLRPDGLPPLTRVYRVAAWQRLTIDIEREDNALANTAVSVTVTVLSGLGIVAERAMWWPGPTSASWSESHVSPGATIPHTTWNVSGGVVGGVDASETYLLVANVTDRPGTARITIHTTRGTRLERDVALPPHARFNVPVALWFPELRDEHFGATVESIGPNPVALVVERSSYWSSARGQWTAGTNALGSSLPSADVVLTITSTGLDRTAVDVPLGGRLRIVNADSVPHLISADGCPPLEPVGALAPGASAVSASFLSMVTCSLDDALHPGTPGASGTLRVY